MDTSFTLHVFAALFAVMNPIANLPVLLSLTDGMAQGERRRVALRTIVGVTVGCAISVAGGTAILGFFGVDTDAFRAAGGVLIFLIALSMMSGDKSAAHHGSERENARETKIEDPSIYPLTVPILVGPGTISTLVAMTNHADGAAQLAGLAAGVAMTIALIAVVFLSAPTLSRYFGDKAESIISRIMGMILAAIGFGMLADGLKGLFPALAGA